MILQKMADDLRALPAGRSLDPMHHHMARATLWRMAQACCFQRRVAPLFHGYDPFDSRRGAENAERGSCGLRVTSELMFWLARFARRFLSALTRAALSARARGASDLPTWVEVKLGSGVSSCFSPRLITLSATATAKPVPIW